MHKQPNWLVRQWVLAFLRGSVSQNVTSEDFGGGRGFENVVFVQWYAASEPRHALLVTLLFGCACIETHGDAWENIDHFLFYDSELLNHESTNSNNIYIYHYQTISTSNLTISARNALAQEHLLAQLCRFQWQRQSWIFFDIALRPLTPNGSHSAFESCPRLLRVARACLRVRFCVFWALFSHFCGPGPSWLWAAALRFAVGTHFLRSHPNSGSMFDAFVDQLSMNECRRSCAWIPNGHVCPVFGQALFMPRQNFSFSVRFPRATTWSMNVEEYY